MTAQVPAVFNAQDRLHVCLAAQVCCDIRKTVRRTVRSGLLLWRNAAHCNGLFSIMLSSGDHSQRCRPFLTLNPRPWSALQTQRTRKCGWCCSGASAASVRFWLRWRSFPHPSPPGTRCGPCRSPLTDSCCLVHGTCIDPFRIFNSIADHHTSACTSVVVVLPWCCPVPCCTRGEPAFET